MTETPKIPNPSPMPSVVKRQAPSPPGVDVAEVYRKWNAPRTTPRHPARQPPVRRK
jgi:hypothetical protein